MFYNLLKYNDIYWEIRFGIISVLWEYGYELSRILGLLFMGCDVVFLML